MLPPGACGSPRRRAACAGACPHAGRRSSPTARTARSSPPGARGARSSWSGWRPSASPSRCSTRPSSPTRPAASPSASPPRLPGSGYASLGRRGRSGARPMSTSDTHFGLTGLATMGANLARNVAHHDIPVVVHNRTTSRMTRFVEEHGSEGPISGQESVGDWVGALARPRVLMSMVQAGPATDAVIDEIAPHLDRGDVLIDGGNANFRDTQRRHAKLSEQGIHFLGVGVSGGEEGALNGPSIMPGGDQAAYDESVREIFEAIAARVDDTPCVTYVGADGAGHFVKMVHNGIEYADMQLIAESYDLLRHGGGLEVAATGQRL